MDPESASAVIVTIGAPEQGALPDVFAADLAGARKWLYSVTGCSPARVHDDSRDPDLLVDVLVLAAADPDLAGTEYVWTGAAATAAPRELVSAALARRLRSSEAADSLLDECSAAVVVRGGLGSKS